MTLIPFAAASIRANIENFLETKFNIYIAKRVANETSFRSIYSTNNYV